MGWLFFHLGKIKVHDSRIDLRSRFPDNLPAQAEAGEESARLEALRAALERQDVESEERARELRELRAALEPRVGGDGGNEGGVEWD